MSTTDVPTTTTDDLNLNDQIDLAIIAGEMIDEDDESTLKITYGFHRSLRGMLRTASIGNGRVYPEPINY